MWSFGLVTWVIDVIWSVSGRLQWIDISEYMNNQIGRQRARVDSRGASVKWYLSGILNSKRDSKLWKKSQTFIADDFAKFEGRLKILTKNTAIGAILNPMMNIISHFSLQNWRLDMLLLMVFRRFLCAFRCLYYSFNRIKLDRKRIHFGTAFSTNPPFVRAISSFC